MSDVFRNVFRPSRIAGGLLMWSAVLDYLLAGALSPVALALGVALAVTEDTSRLDLLRFLVFAWCAISLVLVLAQALVEGGWVPALRTALFVGAVAGLMLDRLPEPTVAILAVVGLGVVFL